ncbi:hypothetical protein ATCC90586_009156 [Pythium insidiosum]|nr:hypothetical protein ATCC90586_009156 [Pythium insidiosum]
MCSPRENTSSVPCRKDPIASEDLARLQRAASPFTLCSMHSGSDLASSWPTRATSDNACGGVLFRQCRVGSQVGMCYNSRLQVIHCELAREYIEMRKLQIERRVGVPCDPLEEAWLGCQKP